MEQLNGTEVWNWMYWLAIYFLFFVLPFNSKDTETFVTTVTVADLRSCWYVPPLFLYCVISFSVPVYSSVDSSWTCLALPKVWFRELVISSAFTLALWTARTQACLLQVKKDNNKWNNQILETIIIILLLMDGYVWLSLSFYLTLNFLVFLVNNERLVWQFPRTCPISQPKNW